MIGHGAARVRAHRTGWALFGVALVVYVATSYAGVRSADSEVVFRTAESLAKRGSFAVPRELEDWPGFGLATGRDGQRYMVFGPLQAVLLVPFVWLGEAAAGSRWIAPRRVPVSHYLGPGYWHILRGSEPRQRRPHAVRSVASLLNALLGAACVAAFFGCGLRLVDDRRAAATLALLLGFGTPLWSYSGTLFSEPLATLLVLLSLRALLGGRREPRYAVRTSLVAGLWLGLGVTAHLSAGLFAPFLGLYPAWSARRSGAPWRRAGMHAAAFWVGVALFLALLAIYNFARFGDPFETGRSVSAIAARANLYGSWTWPGVGLLGLLVGPGKGLFLFAPLTLLGILLWPRLHRVDRELSLVLAAAAAGRLLFLACRSDWHGGWALGPRYLVMLLPVLLLPLGPWLRAGFARWRGRAFAGFGLLAGAAISQQFAFALEDVFLRNRVAWVRAWQRNEPLDLEFGWLHSPLRIGLDQPPAPYLLGLLSDSSATLFVGGVVLFACGLGMWLVHCARRRRPDAATGCPGRVRARG